MKKITAIFLLSLLLWSCGKDEEECAFTPDVSQIELDLTFEHFEDSLVNVPSRDALVDLLTRQPIIRDFILKRTEYPNDSVFINEMYKRFSNPHIDTLLMETKRIFGNDHAELKSDFEQAFKNLKYYYPDFTPPKVQTVVSGLIMGSDLFVSDSLIVVSIDYYLGKTGKYRPNMYDYLLRQYEKENIVPSCMLIYGISPRFNKTHIDDKTVLADMLAYGKSFYFAKQMLPCTPDSIMIWYTEKEIRDSKKNQDLIWKRLVEDQVLYSTSHLVKQKYLGERPKTLDVGPECPGRIGQWVGWQIVKSYMDTHEDVTLSQLMEKDNARNLLESSNYSKELSKR